MISDERDKPAVRLSAELTDGFSMFVSVQTRMNFAVQHMMAAARFSAAVGHVEAAHAGEQFGDFFDEILHNASASIFLSAASLETYANEIYSDRKSLFPDAGADLEREWRDVERSFVLTKFDFFLRKLHKEALSASAPALARVAAVVKLRNALIHFKPEWSGEAERHAELSTILKGQFDPSPFLNDDRVFPRRWATQSCTRWAIRATLDFAAQFEKLAGWPSKYFAHPRSYDGFEV